MSKAEEHRPDNKAQRSPLNLKWSLTSRVALVALACFLAGAAFATYRAGHAAFQANKTAGETIAQQLNLQLLRIDTALDVASRFPDADALLPYVLGPGQCVQYRDSGGKTVFSNCVGTSAADPKAPAWFAQFLRFVYNIKDYTYPVKHGQTIVGHVIATSDPSAVAARAWSNIGPMLALSAGTTAALCLLVYFIIERALLPTKQIISGMNRLARGDLGARLPSFQLSELQEIGTVFNGLAARLQDTITERAQLARRLVENQEVERRHLARELHDELAQSLSALNATAAFIKATVKTDLPSLTDEAEQLAETAQSIMTSMRKVLNELRPHEIDELGLAASLEGLMEEFNARSGGKTRYTLTLTGNEDSLAESLSVHVFRIVQEGLNNAAKHSGAANVHTSITFTDTTPECQPQLHVVVEDDGYKTRSERHAPSGFGLGLRGVRERALALGGTMTFGPTRAGRGSALSVVLPLKQQGDASL